MLYRILSGCLYNKQTLSKFLKHVLFKSKDNPSVIFQIVVNILILFVQCSYYMYVLLQNP